jgi:hypothetical protein
MVSIQTGFSLIVTEVIFARGHENVQSTNRTTFEITKDEHLTRRGDCIIAVGATKGAADLNPEFKEAARTEHARILITIETDGDIEVVDAWGNPQLSFMHPTDLVVRKSDYICSRTLAIYADKVAEDLSRRLVEKMRNPNQKVKITLIVETVT